MLSEDQFARIIADSIKEDGIGGNDFLAIVKKVLPIKKDFYKNIPSENTLKYFQEVVDNGDLEIGSDEDFIPMASKEYWNQPNNSSFIYVMRILPAIREKYPKLYKKVFDASTKQIKMPAGLDDASKKDPNKVTIWNEVEKVDKEEASGKTGKMKSFLKMNDRERRDFIEKELDNMENNNQITQAEANSMRPVPVLNAVSKFLGKFIR